MPILEAIFIGTAAFSALMGLEHSKKTKKKAPKKKNSHNKNKKKAPKKKNSPNKNKKKAPVKKKPSNKRWETKLLLKKQLSKHGFKFTNAQLKKESITDLRKLLKTINI